MTYSALLTICLSCIVGFCAVATILVTGWIKSSHLSELKSDIDKLWEKITKVEVLASRLESVEKGIDEIKTMLRER